MGVYIHISTLENCLIQSTKSEQCLFYDPAILLLGMTYEPKTKLKNVQSKNKNKIHSNMVLNGKKKHK